MKHSNIPGRIFTAIIAGAVLAGIHAQALAEAATDAKPMELRKIMKDLGKNMQAVTDGISREDWEQVAKIAPLIADHPQPPLGEKVRILSFIGKDTGKFKGYDEKVHQAATAMQESAVRRDGTGVIAAFANVQTSCFGCHQSFRKPFVEHFYAQH
ncbi:MAG TPA: cytochrome c [Burkholderiaceae bacterium]|jgi:cytochrome c556|nr:cytochrome c [Burkholderiaceae bacterium]